MTTKTIIPIEIDDSQFRAFYELFQQFQGKVGDLPEDWDKVHESATNTQDALAGAMGVMTESMLKGKDHAKELSEYLGQATEAQKQFGKVTGQAESSLRRMSKDAKELSHTLFGIGKYLFKIGAIGVGATTGALFGIDRLAMSAINNQRSARGLGMTTGQLRAFQTDFGSRYMDDSVLQSVASARNDLTNRVWMQRALGIGSDQMDKSNTGDLAAQLAVKVHDWWSSTPQAQHNDAFYQATGFAQSGISLEMARQLGNTNREELVRARDQYGKDAQGLTVSDHATDSLYGFTRQLDLSGQKLQTLLTNRVSELGPALGNLVDKLEKGAEVLVNEIFSKKNVDALSEGIQTLSNFLGSQEFKDDVKTLVSGIGQIAKAIMAAMRIIAPDSPGGPSNDNGTQVPPGTTYWDNPANAGGDTVINQMTRKGDYTADREYLLGFIPFDKKVYRGPGFENINPATQKGKSNLALMSGLEKSLGLAPGVLAADVEVESGGNPYAVSPKGYKGAMQIGDSVISQYGVINPYDFSENVTKGAMNLARLNDYYKGDLRKALAASNWGEGNLNKAISKYGKEWEGHVPTETSNHLKRVFDVMARNQSKPIKVEIGVTNKSGTDVALSVNNGGL